MSGKSIHLVGIGGVGMAGLAVLLKSRGHAVSGCDLKATARTRWLESMGIRVDVGHSPEHLKGVDEVIVTPAVSRDNPELLACGGIPVRFRGEVLAEIVNAGEGIAVCGSHGKTTTATWTAKLLRALGEPVSWCIGGETGSFPVAGVASIRQSANPTIEQSEQSEQSINSPLVVEADESDGTLALYRARTLVVTNCEYDHPDHFKSREDYVACYETAKRQAGEVVESERLGSLEPLVPLEALAVLEDLPPHNRKNARAAVEVALRRGHRLEDIAHELPSVVSELPDRRFQVVWPVPGSQIKQSDNQTIKQSNNVSVVTDYAHHPSEIACAVGMARAKCRGTLRVLFQPHRYSRTKAFLGDFPAAFEGADEVLLCPVYAAFEQPVSGGRIEDLYEACRRHFKELPAGGTHGTPGVPSFSLCASCDEAWAAARDAMRSGDVTLLLGAGDIISLVPRVQADLQPCKKRCSPV